jgi:hypothetical protein
MSKRLYESDKEVERRQASGRRSEPERASGEGQHLQRPLTPARVMRLQRLAGNASVADLLGARPVLQRSAPSPAETAPPVGTEADAQVALAPPPATATASEKASATEAVKEAGAKTPEELAAARPQLRAGASGAEVKDVQQRLNQAGAVPQLKVAFGPRTARAVRKDQALRGLKADGIAGPKTWLGLGIYKESRPNDKDRATALGKITIETIGHGSSSGAVAAATALQQQQWQNLDLVGLKQLDGLTVELHVIPHNKKLTDLDDFKALKGQTTFDGRLWDDVRGINIGKTGKKIRSAVAEESLIRIKGMPSGYGAGFVAGHEDGHAVRGALSPEQNTALQKLFDDRKKDHAPPAQNAADDAFWLPPSWYAGANSDEYWANSVAAYFNHPYSDDKAVVKMYTPGWLAANDAKMYAFLQKVF